MIKRIRGILQLLFFAIFIAVMITGKAQPWMAFIFLSIIMSGFFGRFYCGWACPINTVMRPFVWMSKKLGLQRKQVPEILKLGRIRMVVFGSFLIGLGYTIYTITQGRKFPLPLIIIPLGVISAFFINEKSWHRYLCPWGVLFNMTARYSKKGIKSDNSCISCSACERICPGDAIKKVEKGTKALVDSSHCLLCFDCTAVCPAKVLSYKGSEKNI